MCVRPATTSIANVTATNRRLLHHSGPVCSRPRHLRRLRLVNADACSTYRVALLRCAASGPSLCTVGHTTDASGRTGAFPAGLWKRRAGRPSGSRDASTPVGSEFIEIEEIFWTDRPRQVQSHVTKKWPIKNPSDQI